VKIGPASVHLRLGGPAGSWRPGVGEQLRLELLLPAEREHGKAKYLSARAAVADVTEQADGSCWLELRFRKPIFKERGAQSALAVSMNPAPVKWKM